MHVENHEKEIIVFAIRLFRISTAVENADLTSEIFKFRLPGIDTMIGNIRMSAGQIIHDSRLLLHMEDRMCLAKRDDMFYKIQKCLIPLIKIPVQPGYLIILTISVVVAILGISEFITCQKHRCSLT